MADDKAAQEKPNTAPPAAAAKPAANGEAAPAPAQAAKPAEASKPAEPAKAAEPTKAPAPKAEAKPAPKAEAKPAARKPAARKAKPAAKAAKAPARKAAPKRAAAKTVKSTAQSIKTGAKTMNQTTNKTAQATKQAAQQATEQFRGVINNASEQGKAAMEKSTRFAEEMADLSRGNMEAVVASSKTAAKYVETLTQGAADYNRRSFEQASATLRSFAEVKSPTDFFRLQSDYARSAFDQMVAESARVSETMVKMSGDVAEPIASRYSVAAERLKAVAA